jgi:hypothetical protein
MRSLIGYLCYPNERLLVFPSLILLGKGRVRSQPRREA